MICSIEDLANYLGLTEQECKNTINEIELLVDELWKEANE